MSEAEQRFCEANHKKCSECGAPLHDPIHYEWRQILNPAKYGDNHEFRGDDEWTDNERATMKARDEADRFRELTPDMYRRCCCRNETEQQGANVSHRSRGAERKRNQT